MPTSPPSPPPPPSPRDLHTARSMAESFGVDPHRYDRARPAYPDELVTRVLGGASHLDLLDVGCGTGIAARQFQAAGATVLGVEPDPRLAAFARDHGVPVEVATFEAWPSDERRFDVVVAAQSWHWIDPVAGPAKAARVLRPGGRLAIFGHVFEPPEEVARAFADAYATAVPDPPFAHQPPGQPARRPVAGYAAIYAKVGADLAATGLFDQVEQWRFDWDRPYTRDEWLDLLPTTGAMTQLGPEPTAEILTAVGAAIDALGGGFTMPYTTLAVVARAALIS